MFPTGDDDGPSGVIFEDCWLGLMGSIHSLSNGSGSLAAHWSLTNASNNKNCLQTDLIRELHEAGLYDYAQGLGIIRNGTIVVPNGKPLLRLCFFPRSCFIDLYISSGPFPGMDIDKTCSELWPGEGEYSLPIYNGIPDGYSEFLVCPSVPLVSMDSGSIGSSSRGSDVAMATPAQNNARVRLRHLDVEEDEFESPGTVGRKKKRVHRTTGEEKGGRGLRHFSMKVCEKVECKGWTTYNEASTLPKSVF
eukprot:Gb_36940 [translate_table: standard]